MPGNCHPLRVRLQELPQPMSRAYLASDACLEIVRGRPIYEAQDCGGYDLACGL